MKFPTCHNSVPQPAGASSKLSVVSRQPRFNSFFEISPAEC
jgi:hypothetical protein